MNHRVLVLGLGNLLLKDEGLGIRAQDLLQARYNLPEDVVCVDGGVLGLELLAYVEGIHSLLVLDAVRNGQESGALVRLEGESIPKKLSLKLSMHQVTLADILALTHMRGAEPPRLVVWGMEPESLESGFGLSPLIADRLPLLVDSAKNELESWGVALTARGETFDPSVLQLISEQLPARNPSEL